VRALLTTLFVLLMVVLTTQTFRHVWVKWVEPKGSVLDEFREPVEKDIAESRSLDELKAMYAKARAGLKTYEEGKSLEEIDLARRTNRSTYLDESQLEQAIRKVEDQDRTVFQVWFYWGWGLVSILLGLFAMARVDPWLGVVGLITGFGEMAIVTNPLYRSFGPQAGFERLLTLKLVLSVATVVLLLSLWLLSRRRARSQA
jgi:hypothetical protein